MALVTLKQLVGRRPIRNGQFQVVKHAVDEVLYDDQLVGQIARHANPTLCLYYPQSKQMIDEIIRGIKAVREKDEDGKNWLPNNKSVSPPTDDQVEEAVDAILEQEAAESEEEAGESEE